MFPRPEFDYQRRRLLLLLARQRQRVPANPPAMRGSRGSVRDATARRPFPPAPICIRAATIVRPAVTSPLRRFAKRHRGRRVRELVARLSGAGERTRTIDLHAVLAPRKPVC